MPPSSANVNAPQSAIAPAIPQARSISPPSRVRAAVWEGVKKIPTPMMAPTTTQVASIGPSVRASRPPSGGSGADICGGYTGQRPAVDRQERDDPAGEGPTTWISSSTTENQPSSSHAGGA